MNKLFIFVLGATAGSLLTWKLLDEKYRRLAEDEIEAVREYYDAREKIQDARERVQKVVTFNEKQEEPKIEIENAKEARQKKLNEKLKNLGYDISEEDHFSITEGEDGSIWVGPGEDYIDPYVIPPDEFGEIDSYDTKSWTYYSDHVITDDLGEIVYDPEGILGDSLIHFGEYEDDAIHVRNENLECDYEIIKSEKAFNEINGRIMDDIPPRS